MIHDEKLRVRVFLSRFIVRAFVGRRWRHIYFSNGVEISPLVIFTIASFRIHKSKIITQPTAEGHNK